MMIDWNEYQKALLTTIGKLAQISPETVSDYQALHAAGKKTNLLGAKVRELIALAVAVTTHCDGCITVHTSNAIKAGVTKEEIAEAIGVAVAMNAGAALVYSARVMDAYATKTENEAVAAS